MNHIERLKKLLADSATHINIHGHHQDYMWERKACCIMGAPRMIDNDSSYSHIARHVLAGMGYDEIWNDKPGRTKEEVVSALRWSSENLSEETMKSVYGPRWSGILDFITGVDDWSEDQHREIEATHNSFTNPPEYDPSGQFYLNALASYMATVVTSKKLRTDSKPYKAYFDKKYKEGL